MARNPSSLSLDFSYPSIDGWKSLRENIQYVLRVPYMNLICMNILLRNEEGSYAL
jgi:hypothetical protein